MTPPTDADPMPQPPQRPGDDECCGNGCDPCIMDFHDIEMDRYRRALREWQARQPQQQQESVNTHRPASGTPE